MDRVSSSAPRVVASKAQVRDDVKSVVAASKPVSLVEFIEMVRDKDTPSVYPVTHLQEGGDRREIGDNKAINYTTGDLSRNSSDKGAYSVVLQLGRDADRRFEGLLLQLSFLKGAWIVRRLCTTLLTKTVVL